jgi:hypothetical protein
MEHDAATGISRRNALKRIGAGAAVAWTTPAIMSMSTAASAGSPSPCVPGTGPCGKGAPCDVHADCGPPGSGCACFFLTDGTQFCSAGEYGCNGTLLCETNDDCPCGWACVSSCCPQSECRPPCGQPNPAGAGTGSSL